MKKLQKLLISSLLLTTLIGCSAPNTADEKKSASTVSDSDKKTTDENKENETADKEAPKEEEPAETPDNGFLTVTKTQYVALMDCYAEKIPAKDKYLFNINQSSAKGVPEANWAETVKNNNFSLSPMKQFYNRAIDSGCSV